MQNPFGGSQAGQSALYTLFKGWGIELTGQVVADLTFASGQGGLAPRDHRHADHLALGDRSARRRGHAGDQPAIGVIGRVVHYIVAVGGRGSVKA